MDMKINILQQEVAVSEKIFKQCPLCGKIWRDVDEFLTDNQLYINGYQGSLNRLFEGRERVGLLLFTHNTENCGTTLAFTAETFRLNKKQ